MEGSSRGTNRVCGRPPPRHSNGIPERVDPSAKATLKKKWQGATFSLSLTDATLKDQGKTLKDLVVGVEKKLAGEHC